MTSLVSKASLLGLLMAALTLCAHIVHLLCGHTTGVFYVSKFPRYIVASCVPQTGDLARNPGMCTDRVSVTSWFTGQCSIHWATPARAKRFNITQKYHSFWWENDGLFNKWFWNNWLTRMKSNLDPISHHMQKLI